MKRDVCLFERIVGVAMMLVLSAGIVPGVRRSGKDAG